MLLKLADIAAVLCPMARVVHAWGNFIDDQPIGGHEQLDPHDADIIQSIQDLSGQKNRIHALGGGQSGRHCCAVQNPLAMDILTRIIAGHLPIAGTGRDHRYLMAEIDKAFQHGGRALHGLPCFCHV